MWIWSTRNGSRRHWKRRLGSNVRTSNFTRQCLFRNRNVAHDGRSSHSGRRRVSPYDDRHCLTLRRPAVFLVFIGTSLRAAFKARFSTTMTSTVTSFEPMTASFRFASFGWQPAIRQTAVRSLRHDHTSCLQVEKLDVLVDGRAAVKIVQRWLLKRCDLMATCLQYERSVQKALPRVAATRTVGVINVKVRLVRRVFTSNRIQNDWTTFNYCRVTKYSIKHLHAIHSCLARLTICCTSFCKR